MGWEASLTEHPRHRGTGGAKALRQNIRDAHEEQDWANGADGLMGEHHLGPCGPCEDFSFYSKRNAKSSGGLEQRVMCHTRMSLAALLETDQSYSPEFPKSLEPFLLLLLNTIHSNSGGTWLLPKPEP